MLVDEDQSSMYDSGSQYEDCLSENSFGSDFGDNATDEESDLTTTALDTDIELNSPSPVYPDEEYPFLPVAMDLKPPPAALSTLSTNPTEPTSNANFSGRSMCIVRGLIFNPAIDGQLIDMLGLQTCTCLQ